MTSLTAAPPLHCIECGTELERSDDRFACPGCGAEYPVRDGTARMLPEALRAEQAPADGESAVKRRTAASFAYEWGAFGAHREQWRKNFLDYMKPHGPAFFDGLSVLDVGTGSGRHAAQAAELGASVTAVDLGDAIDVARRNLPERVSTVQADAEALPFAPGSFDFVMSIGVLHHLPDTERALRGLRKFVRPGGRLHIYLYWLPERAGHRFVLRGVSMVRRITTRMPHRLLHALCYPLSAALFVGIVLPYRAMRRVPFLSRVADSLPLKIYADYPFGVLVNDQFDRFSAPIERRFTRAEAEKLMLDAGLEDVKVIPNHGWVCDGRLPAELSAAAPASRGLPPAGVRLRAVAAQSPSNPGFRIRVLLLERELAQQGVTVEASTLFDEAQGREFRERSLPMRGRLTAQARRKLLDGLREEDPGNGVTLIQRQVDMWPSLTLERAAAGNGPLVWDIDDAIWFDTSPEARQHPLAVLKGTRRKVKWLAQRADHVIVGNWILADYLAELTNRITVVPSVVEPRSIALRDHAETGTITIGWIGSAGTAPYLAPMAPILTALKRRLGSTNVKLLLVGGTTGQIDGVGVESVPWSPAAEMKALAEMDIGVMPMPDVPWTRGKCSYKALQYMAAGIPAVASDVGVARDVIGGGGRVITGEADWVDALAELAGDAGLRRRLGSEARARVERDYSVERWAPVVADVVRGVL